MVGSLHVPRSRAENVVDVVEEEVATAEEAAGTAATAEDGVTDGQGVLVEEETGEATAAAAAATLEQGVFTAAATTGETCAATTAPEDAGVTGLAAAAAPAATPAVSSTPTFEAVTPRALLKVSAAEATFSPSTAV